MDRIAIRLGYFLAAFFLFELFGLRREGFFAVAFLAVGFFFARLAAVVFFEVLIEAS